VSVVFMGFSWVVKKAFCLFDYSRRPAFLHHAPRHVLPRPQACPQVDKGGQDKR